MVNIMKLKDPGVFDIALDKAPEIEYNNSRKVPRDRKTDTEKFINSFTKNL
jgi:hypothetical protein